MLLKALFTGSKNTVHAAVCSTIDYKSRPGWYTQCCNLIPHRWKYLRLINTHTSSGSKYWQSNHCWKPAVVFHNGVQSIIVGHNCWSRCLLFTPDSLLPILNCIRHWLHYMKTKQFLSIPHYLGGGKDLGASLMLQDWSLNHLILV